MTDRYELCRYGDSDLARAKAEGRAEMRAEAAAVCDGLYIKTSWDQTRDPEWMAAFKEAEKAILAIPDQPAAGEPPTGGAE